MGIFKLADGKFRVQIRRKGFPNFDKVFHTKSEAEQALKVQERQLSSLPSDGNEMTLQEAWDRYVLSAYFSEKALRTQETEVGRIKPVLKKLGAYSLKNLADRPSIVMDYIDERSRTISDKTGRKISGTSVRLEVAALSAVAHWAVERRIILKNFVRDVRRPSTERRKRRVSVDEQAQLGDLSRLDWHGRGGQGARFLLLMRYLGCRPGELARLLKEDVRFKSGDVTFRKTKAKKEDRLVHATPMAQQILAEQYEHANEFYPVSPYVFSTLIRGQASNRASAKAWVPFNYSSAVTTLKRGGWVPQDFHAHAMRREFISRAIEDGLSYADIRKQTGHHSTQAIEIYDEALSTAPETRKRLDAHEKTIQDDNLKGMLKMYFEGASDDDISDAIDRLKGKKPSGITKTYPNGEVVSIKKG